MKKILAILSILVLVSFNQVIAQTGQSPYPILFVHGLISDDSEFILPMEYLRSNYYPSIPDIYVFDVILNADNETSTSNYTSDVNWDDWTFEGEEINVGRRTYANVNEDMIDGWVNSSARLYAINFAEERVRGAADIINDLFDYSNEAALYKQGYALKQAISEILEFTQCDKIILVGHSMGGLAIREYLQRTDDGTQNSNHTWWVNPSDTEFGHQVAKVVTIGTPHGGSNIWNIVTRSGSPPNANAEAARDMRYQYGDIIGNGPNPNTDDGIYLFGGTESDLYTGFNGYFNADVNCDGNGDGIILGINSHVEYEGGFMCIDNPQLHLPTNIEYTWITSDNGGFGAGDGVVRRDRQWLYGIGDTLLIYENHSNEPDNIQSIIRGLDEPDQAANAYKLTPDGTAYLGFTTYQPDMAAVDVDYFYFTADNDGYATLDISNVFNTTSWELEALHANDESHIFSIDQGASESSGAMSVPVLAGESYLIKFTGSAIPQSYANPYTIDVALSSHETGTITDIDGNVYQTIKIGNQWWMAENLRVTHYRNGESIPNLQIIDDWASTTDGAYCYYENDTTNVSSYGTLYNWYAVGDTRNLAPEGWHVPTDADFQELEMYLGMSQSEAEATSFRGTNEGSKLANNAPLWVNGALENNSQFGIADFDAFPGGYRSYTSSDYRYLGERACFWSSTESGAYAWFRWLLYNYSEVYRLNLSKRIGMSVRCVMGNLELIIPPQNLSAEPRDRAVNLDWNDHAHVELAGYNVYRRSTDSSYLLIASITSGSPLITSSFIDTDVLNGIPYHYVVSAIDGVGNESNYSDEVIAIPNGPIAFFPFNGDATDSSGSGFHGSVNGATLTQDRFGFTNRAFSFDGIDDDIDFGNPSNGGLDFGSDDFTFIAWVYKNDALNAGLFSKREYPYSANSHELYMPLNLMYSRNGNVYQCNANDALQVARWVQVGITFEGSSGDLKFWVDGETFGPTIQANTEPVDNDVSFYLGRETNPAVNRFHGKIDDILIYKRVLTEVEIQEIYHQGGWPLEGAISEISASQRSDGSKLVDIYYRLEGPSQYYMILPEISYDGGETYQEINYATGNIGHGVSPGDRNHIVWDVGLERSQYFGTSTQVQIIVEESNIPPIDIVLEWIAIPAGPYIFGSQDEIRNDIDYNYYISKYEVTNAQFVEYLQEALGQDLITVVIDGSSSGVYGFYAGDEHHNAGEKKYLSLYGGDPYQKIYWENDCFTILDGYESHPVGNVTWYGANAFVKFYDLQLPTQYEWEKAARGNTGYMYPWGDNQPTCDLAVYQPCDGQTREVGLTTGVSPYGVFDMAGNVNEYCDGWYLPWSSERIMRGGWWGGSSSLMYTYYNGHTSPDYGAYNSRGFRPVLITEGE